MVRNAWQAAERIRLVTSVRQIILREEDCLFGVPYGYEAVKCAGHQRERWLCTNVENAEKS